MGRRCTLVRVLGDRPKLVGWQFLMLASLLNLAADFPIDWLRLSRSPSELVIDYNDPLEDLLKAVESISSRQAT